MTGPGRRGGRRLTAAALTVLLALALALPLAVALPMVVGSAGRAAAATVSFDPPGASGRLGGTMTFSDAFATASRPDRVELLRDEPLIGGALVTEASVSALGGGRYRATVDDPEHVLPNTTVRYRFRVVLGEDATEGPSATFTLEDTRYRWQVVQGQHVRLHWHEGSEDFARRALAIGDKAIADVSALLGVREDRPIDFFVYATKDGLDGALGPGTSEFVAGRAAPEIRTLFAEIAPGQIDSDWVDVVIPHELTHLVFDTATANAYHQPPLWLNEGLAVYESEGYGAADRGRVRDAVRGDALLPLAGLSGAFPQRQDLFYLSYAESVSAIDFLVRTYGQPKLVQLIRGYADGVTDDEAFRSATGAGLGQFEEAWLSSLGAAAPQAYGPRLPAAGPLPPGWSPAGGVVSGSPLPTTAAVRGGSPLGAGGALAAGLDTVYREVVLPFLAMAAGSAVLLGLVLFLRRRTLAEARLSPSSPPAPSPPSVPPPSDPPPAPPAAQDRP